MTTREFKKKSFNERHHRMTIYLENEIYEEIQYRREQGRITNLTRFFNSILKEKLGKE